MERSENSLISSVSDHFRIFKIFVDMLGRLKATDAGRLRAEYNRLVEGLAQRGDLPSKFYITIRFMVRIFTNLSRWHMLIQSCLFS